MIITTPQSPMAKCIECGNFTKFEDGYYRNCYHKNNNVITEDSGLSEKDRRYRFNMINGSIAETLVQELFLTLNYNVFRYGMENTIPGLMHLQEDIKRMPDFVVQNPKTGNVYFIEVKFRADGEFNAEDLPNNYPYTNAYIILVSKKHIKCLTVKELLDGKEITTECRNYLGSRKEFDLDKNVIIEFCNFAVKFFENV